MISKSRRAIRLPGLTPHQIYRDLTPYQIRVALEEDGWHIDYNLKDPRAKGGGPHYVIHRATAAILPKRYEQ